MVATRQHPRTRRGCHRSLWPAHFPLGAPLARLLDLTSDAPPRGGSISLHGAVLAGVRKVAGSVVGRRVVAVSVVGRAVVAIPGATVVSRARGGASHATGTIGGGHLAVLGR